MNNSRSFFASKKPWSELKDRLLYNYIPPYLEKIKMLNRPIIIVDCFAGIGRFDDNTSGSPLIFIDRVNSSNAKSMTKLILIEKEYADELKKNLPTDTTVKYEVWEGCYEDHINKLLEAGKGANVFLYIDPYGAKSLDFSFFKTFKSSSFNTVEILMNFNAYGFLREGCRLMKYNIKECSDDDTDSPFDKANTTQHWDSIASGTYWQDLLKDVVEKRKLLNQAEELFIKQYICELRKIYDYVVDFPIKLKDKIIPKYRMIYATMNHHGAFLMVDEMHKAWIEALNESRHGQGDLFGDEMLNCVNPFTEVQDFDRTNLTSIILSRLINGEESMRAITLDIIKEKGITYSSGDYKKAFKELDKAGRIKIRREIEKTPTGLQSKSFDFVKENIFVEAL